LGSLNGRDNSEQLGVGGRIILKCIFRRIGFGVWFGFIWFRIKTNACEHGSEP
jgi:hypothetical protein